jgi:hypothetical protein
MATSPWVTPAEVKAYSDRPEIADRADTKLAVDISRAEAYVTAYTNNDFSEYDTIPGPIKTAVILLAEYYGAGAVKGFGLMKSETFDDYSYEAAEGALIDVLGIGPLLDAYVIAAPKNGVTMKLRAL